MDLSTARTLLLERAKQITGIGKLTVENENYQAGNRQPWARFSLTPLETRNETIGMNPLQSLQGIATIQLFEARGADASSLYGKADAVVAAFPPFLGTEPDFVHIEKVWALSIIEGKDYAQLNVLVRWYAFKQTA